MQICYEGHPEIVYDTRSCPMCELKNDHQDEIQQKDEEIEELEDEVYQRDEELAEVNEKLKALEHVESIMDYIEENYPDAMI